MFTGMNLAFIEPVPVKLGESSNTQISGYGNNGK